MSQLCKIINIYELVTITWREIKEKQEIYKKKSNCGEQIRRGCKIFHGLQNGVALLLLSSGFFFRFLTYNSEFNLDPP